MNAKIIWNKLPVAEKRLLADKISKAVESFTWPNPPEGLDGLTVYRALEGAIELPFKQRRLLVKSIKDSQIVGTAYERHWVREEPEVATDPVKLSPASSLSPVQWAGYAVLITGVLIVEGFLATEILGPLRFLSIGAMILFAGMTILVVGRG